MQSLLGYNFVSLINPAFVHSPKCKQNTKAYTHLLVLIHSSNTFFNSMPIYHHSPLSQPDRNIRLLQLLPRREDPENLRCKIFECVLHNSDLATRPYEALSYFWGSGQKSHFIIIEDCNNDNDKEMGGQELEVTENFYTALSQLQDYDIPRMIWADAVCIDQLNTREKEMQIPLMAEIYAKASQVIVWLGEARDNSDEALDMIRIIAESSMSLPKKRLPVHSLLLLLERPWFRRIWVSTEPMYPLTVTKCFQGFARSSCCSACPGQMWLCGD
jgi:hypothetical protein